MHITLHCFHESASLSEEKHYLASTLRYSLADRTPDIRRIRRATEQTAYRSTAAKPTQAMAKNLQLQPVHEGFQQPTGANALEAKMTTLRYEDEKMVITSGSEVLWTQFMSHCRSVATYTPSTGVRSLTHLQGGDASDVFYRKLVPILTKDSRIILIAGGSDVAINNEEDFTTRILGNFREEMDEQLRVANMASRPPLENYEAYWSNAGPKGDQGFVFKPDGRYGILNPNGAP